MAGPSLVVSIVGDAGKLNQTLGESEQKISAFGKSIDVGMVAGLGAAAGAAVVVTKALADMTIAAEEDAAEAARLETAIVAAGAATGDYAAVIDEAIASSQRRAITDTEARNALVPLVGVTGDATKAAELLAVAQDIAALAGTDGEAAAKAVAKAYAGQDAALRKMLPGLDEGATGLDLIALAGKRAEGQANANARGSVKMQIAMDELGETVGSVLLPVMEELVPALLPLLEVLGTLVKAVLPVVTPAIKALAKAFGAMIDPLVKIIDWLSKLIAKLDKAAREVSEFLGNLNPLKNFKFPSLPFTSSAGTSSAGAATTRAGAQLTGGGLPAGVVINITGDPITIERSVVRALRTYSRRNGGLGAVT
jgi:phage-related protein